MTKLDLEALEAKAKAAAAEAIRNMKDKSDE